MPVVWATFGIFSAMRDPNDFLSRLVTMDETWLYHYDKATVSAVAAWGSSCPTPKNSKCKNPVEKFSPASIFWDQDGILIIDYLPKGQTINKEYY